MSSGLREKSSGAVVFRIENGKAVYLLLHYTAGHWDFPKGNVEKGETLEETALREVMEETGIERLKLIPGFTRIVRYYYKRGGATVFKEVVFHLGRTDSRDVRISHEHLAYEWLSFEGAIKRLTYKNAKIVLKEAEAFIRRLSKGSMSLDRFFVPNSKGFER